MHTDTHGRLWGSTTGYHDRAVFKRANGQVWQQSQYRYHYHYAYQPMVRLFRDGSQQMLQIEGTQEAVPVVQVFIEVEGQIVSQFRGFKNDAQFEFQNGQIWKPAEYKYQYHYAYRPNAMVVAGVGGSILHVEGMTSSLRVRRAR